MTALAAIEKGTECAETRFRVPGISCAGCIARIERDLVAEPDILSARVRFSGKIVTVVHDLATEIPALIERFSAIGFEAQPFTEEADASDGSAVRDLLKRIAVAGFAVMNVMLLSVSIWSGAEDSTRDLFHRISALIALPAIAYAGRPFFASALSALRSGRTNMDVPISIGVMLVTGMSFYEVMTGGRDAWFDGALMLLFFLLAGRALDAAMRVRAEDGIRSLLKQRPAGAEVLDSDGRTAWRATNELAPGMRMHVAAGDRLAADGLVEEGISDVDTSLLTGESLPRRVDAGDEVHAGILNLTGPLTVKVTRAGESDTIGVMSGLLSAATQGKSRYVRFADRAARLYAPAVHFLALIAFLGWLAAGAGWHQSLLIATAVLIITCPCALGLAVPAAQVIACGRLMRSGILVRSETALERMSEANAVAFDKTGTLTEGLPLVSGLDAIPYDLKPSFLGLTNRSRHPLSVAVARTLSLEGIEPASVEDVREVAGDGLFGRASDMAISFQRVAEGADMTASEYRHGPDGPFVVRFEDHLRADAPATVSRLQRRGLQATLLSGDQPALAHAVANALGIRGEGGLRPQDKQAAVSEAAAENRRTLMVGDGLNDSLALAGAHVSMAPAEASDVAQQAADIVYLGRTTGAVVEAVDTAKRTMRIVRQNVAFAVAYNVCAVPLAMAGLVSPLVAAVAMSASSAIVVGNAGRLAARAR